MKRHFNRFRYDYRSRKVNNRINFVSADQVANQFGSPTSPTTIRALDGTFSFYPRAKIIEHHDFFAQVDQLIRHMTADVAGAACDKYTH